eukprot:gene9121-biopygen9168
MVVKSAPTQLLSVLRQHSLRLRQATTRQCSGPYRLHPPPSAYGHGLLELRAGLSATSLLRLLRLLRLQKECRSGPTISNLVTCSVF